MAKRLTTRLSAGAALVTGLGMVGVATAAPASAEVTGSLDYTCVEAGTGINFEDPWAVELTLDVPEQVEQGETIPAGEITASVTPGEDAVAQMQNLGVETLEPTEDGVTQTTYTFGENGEARTVEFGVEPTDVPDEGEVTVAATGESVEETAPEEDVNVPITAGDFSAELQNQDGFVFTIECTAPDDATVGTVAVGNAEPPAEEEPPTEEEPPAEEDGSGDDTEEPPANDAGDDGSGDAGDGAGTGDPEVPDVVQTDAGPAGTDTNAVALGGLLLAGAGAGAVVVARRRAAQH